MKKPVAILLLAIHLFNLAGYSLLFQCLINKSDSQLVQQLDSNTYNDKDLVQVKVPLHMPYINDSRDFERVDGQLEMNGIHYNYVKRKVTGDTLYVLCLPNISKTQLYSAKAACANENSNAPTNKKNTESIKKAGFDKEYSYAANKSAEGKFVIVSPVNYPAINAGLQETFIPIPEQPPKASC